LPITASPPPPLRLPGDDEPATLGQSFGRRVKIRGSGSAAAAAAATRRSIHQSLASLDRQSPPPSPLVHDIIVTSSSRHVTASRRTHRTNGCSKEKKV